MHPCSLDYIASHYTGHIYSIAITAHNEEDTIAKCVNSAKAQTTKPDRIVVLNDGSTDNTGMLLAEIPDIVVLTAPSHKSYIGSTKLSISRNRVIKNAVQPKDTKYVLCLDGDIELPSTYAHEILTRVCDTDIVVASGKIEGKRCPLMPLEPGRMIYMPWFSQLGYYPIKLCSGYSVLVAAVLEGLHVAAYGDITMTHLHPYETKERRTSGYHYGAGKAAIGANTLLALWSATRVNPDSLLDVWRGMRGYAIPVRSRRTHIHKTA